MTDLIYIPERKVEFCTNVFVNTPVILRYDVTPMLEIVQAEQAGYTTQIPIYHNDGTYLAKCFGSQIYRTPAGKKAGVELRFLPGVTACELGGKTLFEIRRTEAAALKTDAELYTPDGSFLKSSDHGLTGTVLNPAGQPFTIGGGSPLDQLHIVGARGAAIRILPGATAAIANAMIVDCAVGIQVWSEKELEPDPGPVSFVFEPVGKA
jgi:hypothetical protein